MRFFAVVIIWVIIVGGLFAYTKQRDAAVRSVTAAPLKNLQVEGNFRLILTPTFSLEKDPFALQDSSETDAPLRVSVNGDMINIPENNAERGRDIVISPLKGVVRGYNELFVQASPPFGETDLSHGIRIQVLENQNAIAEKTIWGSNGALVSGSLNFEYGRSKGEEHDH